MMRIRTFACVVAMASLFFSGCATRSVHAPVIDRASSPSSSPKPAPASAPAATLTPDTRADTYTVKRGDTLFSIALDQGLDYKELASWNSLDNPNVIRVGQELRIKPPPGGQESPVTSSIGDTR